MKTCRIELRSSSKEKEKFLEAAALLNFDNLSDFLRAAAKLLSQHAFEEQERITLADCDRDILLVALSNPPKPSTRLKEAMRDYRNAIST